MCVFVVIFFFVVVESGAGQVKVGAGSCGGRVGERWVAID